jgi:oligopeptide transport system permease protein
VLRFLFLRFLQSLGVLACVYTATFWLLMATPGDPFLGDQKKPSEIVLRALREKYMIDKPAQAYVRYAWRIVRYGDFGPTIQYENWTVREVIAQSLPVSVALGALALLMALWMGVLVGTLGAVNKGRWLDHALTVGSLAGISLPTFVVGVILLMAFAVAWPLLPSGGWGTLQQLVLPALTLSLFYLAYIARLTRASVLDVLSADYVRTARAKGLSKTRLVTRHVLGNASLPILSYMGPAAATVLTGSFVVEKVFAIPGLGSHFVNACLNRDIPLVLGSVLVYTALVVAFNLLVDIAYVAADPRIALA